MTAVMFDSDTPDLLLKVSAPGQRLATYADLLTPAFIKAAGDRLVVIDRGRGDPHSLATVVDIERGTFNVGAGVARARQLIQEGRRQVTLYHNRSSNAAVDAALGDLHLHRWIATLDGTPVVPGMQSVAVQVFGASALGFHADMSIIWNDGWLAPSLPTVPKVPASLAGDIGSVEDAVNRLVAELKHYT